MATHIHNSTDCHQYLQQISDYIDGDLDQQLCKTLEQHMAGCTNCTVVVNTLKRTIELYKAEEGDNPLPDEAKKRLFSRLFLDDFLK
ncbi:MAG: anti-sigma factor [Anaerolineaceae bacterium]